MTSISAATTSWQRPDLSWLLQKQMTADIASGQISQTDGTALTSALGSITASLETATSSTGAASTAPPTSESLKARISSLIDNQLSSGALTSGQAAELKQVFQQAFGSDGQTGSVEGAHHGHHHHAAPTSADAASDPDGDGDPLTAGSTTSSSTSTDPSAIGAVATSDATGSSSSATQKLVAQFLQSLQQAASNGYGAAGTASSPSQSALLVDLTA